MPEKVIHEIRLNQYSAVPADRTRRFSLGTKDSYGIEQLRIVPGEGWDGLTITATFHPPEGEAVQVLVPADGLIDVPPEATRSGSELPLKYGRIVFAGVADGMQRISCNLPYTVMGHEPVDGAASSGPSPSWYEQAAAHFVPSGGKAGQVLAKASDTDLDVEWADGGNGTADHAKLSNRDASDQHPISAITGLENALKGKQPAGDYLTADTLQAATDAALAQAKATGEFDGEQGPKGDTGLRGEKGDTGPQGPKGDTGAAGATGPAGADGISPHIGSNGNWYTGDTDTGVSAQGPKGDTGPKGEQGPQGPAGAYGKSAYQYAVDGGYTGTEAEFAAKLAQEIPTALPNPNALTFTGAVTGSYDGSAPLSVEIPKSGSYTLPIASDTTLGGVMPVAKTDDMTQAVGVDAEGKLYAPAAAGAGGGETVVRSEETLAEGIIPVDTPIYSFTNTGLTFQEILKTWKIFYIQTYTTAKNQMNITGFANNNQPIFGGAFGLCYQCIVFFSLGKESNTVMWKRYGSPSNGNFWDSYSPAGKADIGSSTDMETIRDISPSVGLFLRNYGAAATAEIKWKVSGLMKWSNVQ